LLHVKFVAIPAFVRIVEVPCDNSASLRVNLRGRCGVSSFGQIAENIRMSTRIGLSTKLPLPLLPVNHCTQDNSVPLAADVFDLPNRSGMSRGPFFIRSVDNTTSFLKGPGCLCPGEIEDEASAG